VQDVRRVRPEVRPEEFGDFGFRQFLDVFAEFVATVAPRKIGLPQYGYSYKFRNQDRQFSARLRVWKEGWWKEWTPQIVVGANDPSTNDVLGDPNKDDYGFTGTSSVGNGHWNRYYIVATKHFGVKNVGELGMHFGYVYNKRLDYHRNGPVAGVNFQFALPATSFWMKAVNGLNVIAEYDSYSVNCGIGYNFWKDYISGVFIAISGIRATFKQALGLLALGSFVSLLMSWAISSAIASQIPSLHGPYLPSMIAMLIGFSSNRLPTIFKSLSKQAESKLGVKDD
jgi:hypothetical protein